MAATGGQDMRAIVVGLLASLFAACGGAYSINPASEGSQTGQDARLVGFWRAEGESAKEQDVLAVGRRDEQTPGFDLVYVSLKGDTLESNRMDMWPTKIGGKDYASIGFAKEGKPETRRWMILRYDVPDPDTLRVFGMDEKTVAGEVRDKKVSGEVSQSKDEPPTTTVTLDASTSVLRAWLEARGDGLYNVEKPLVLKRVRFK
jgi:hypothetical protein